MRKNIKWPGILAAGIIILIILSAAFISVPAIAISEQRGEELLIIPMLHDTEFHYEYIHSVQLTPVQEHFVPTPDNQILLTSTTYQSFGVGLPFLPEEGELLLINGKYELTGMNRIYDKLNIGFIPLAHQAMIYDGKRYDFEEYFESGALLEVTIEHYSPLKIIWKSIRGAYSD